MHYVALGLLAVTLGGCAAPSQMARARTPAEARAYQAWDKCWNAGGPPSLDFVAVEEGGRLYALADHSFGSAVPPQKRVAIETCMREQGVVATWGQFPPGMMGGGSRRDAPTECQKLDPVTLKLVACPK